MRDDFDAQLITDYLSGDQRALEILISRYLKPIFGFVYRYVGNAEDAEDIVQNTFVKVWRNLKKFDQNKSFKTWVFCLAKNTAIDFLRKKKTIPFSSLSAQGDDQDNENTILETLADPAPLPDELFEQKDLARTLNLVLEKLPSKYRLVLFLHYNDHFALSEIAELLAEPAETIKSRHRRALIALRKLLVKSP